MRPKVDRAIFKARNFSRINDAELNKFITSSIEHSVPPESVDNLCSFFTNTITTAYDTFAPSRSILCNTRRKPWVNNGIRILMKQRDKVFKQARAANSKDLFDVYKDLRRTIRNLIDTSKNKFISNQISNSANPKQLWSIFKNLGFSSFSRPSPFKFFSANSINSHFASVCRQHPPASLEDLNSTLSLHFNPLFPVFSFTDINLNELNQALKKCSSKAKGIDGLSIDMITRILPSCQDLLLQIFNFSLRTATYPDLWKASIISPLAKINAVKSLSDLRPISLLCTVSKLFERIIHNKISSFLQENKLITSHQVGYRPHHSTQAALIELTDDIKAGIDCGDLTILVLFDLSKAFDSVNHHVLLHKLRSLNFDDNSIKWFHSYLSGRTQAVVDGSGLFSNWLRVTCGVPQGSVLGPLLFLLYMNDVPNFIRFSKIIMFVDDTQIYLQCSPDCLEEAVKVISEDATSFANWVTRNGLKLNLDKTKVMIFGNHHNLSKINLSTCPPVTINGQPISYVTSTKDLGVWLDQELSWKTHVSKIVSKVNSSLFCLRMHKHALSFSVRKHLVETLIFPQFDYACVPLLNCSKGVNAKLEGSLNSAVRFVFRIPRYFHISYYRNQLLWLKVSHRRLYFLGTLLYSLFTSGLPIFLAIRFTPLNMIEGLRILDRNRWDEYFVHITNTSIMDFSFTVYGAYFWNNLNINLRNLENISTFKSALFNHLLHIQNSS